MKNKPLKIIIALIAVFAVVFPMCSSLARNAEAYGYIAYGIDVSKWQGDIDWNAVKASGIDFVIIKVGNTSNDSKGKKDPNFEKYYTGAKLAGLNVGAYFYSTAESAAEAAVDAENVKGWIVGKKFEYPIYIDMEDPTYLLPLTTKVRTDICISFNTVLEKAGYMVGVYANRNWLTNYLDWKTLVSKNYCIWEAVWAKSGKPDDDLSDECGVWQYYDKGRINGISVGKPVDVDLDVSYVNYPEIIKSKGLNGFPKNSSGDTSRGYYTNTDALNLRDAPGISGKVLLTIPKGTKLAVTEMNADSTWAKTSYNGKSGWVSTNYISFKENFKYTVKYVTGSSTVTAPPSSAYSALESASFTSSGMREEGRAFVGWTVKRMSDGLWYASDGKWKALSDSSNDGKMILKDGSSLTFNDSNLNLSVGDDTYTAYGVWKTTFLLGDANGSGNVDPEDVLALRRYLAGIITDDDINLQNADVDKSGEIDVRDVLKIRRYLAGLVKLED